MAGTRGAGGPPMSREEVDDALGRVRAQRERIAANLLDLENSVGHRFLSGEEELHGVTLRRWEEAKAHIATLWQLFDAYQRVSAEAERLGVGRVRLGPAELAELTRLLRGDSVELPREETSLAERSLLDSPREHLSLETAVARMTEAFERAAEMVTAAEAAWSALHPMLAEVDSLQAEIGTLAGRLGSAPAEYERLAEESAAVGRIVRGDPLAWAPSSSGGTGTARIERLRDDLVAIRTELAAAVQVRDGYPERSSRIAEAIGGVAAEVRAAGEARAEALAKISAPPAPVPDPVPGLRARMDELERLRDSGRWTDLAAAAADLDSAVSAALPAVRDARQEWTALLRRRAELRGLLDAYRAKAARLGSAERPELLQAHQRAQNLLWTAPCDLDEAAAALQDYQRAIRVTAEERGGTQ